MLGINIKSRNYEVGTGKMSKIKLRLARGKKKGENINIKERLVKYDRK